MNRLKHKLVGMLATGALLGMGAGMIQGCDDAADKLGECLDLPDLECSAQGLVDGNASISGIPSIDAFFGAVVNLDVKSKSVSSGINAEIKAIKGAFGYSPDVDFGAAFAADADMFLEAGIEVKAEPPSCQVDAQASVEASARCDVDVDLGSVEVECQGGCEVDVNAEIGCSAEAELSCTVSVTAEAGCTGSCTGTCTVALEAAAGCEGTCRGECSGDCSAYVQNTEGGFDCAGACEGECTGTCEAEVVAEAGCEGSCSGECHLEGAAEADCQGALRAECTAQGDASIMCSGGCTGEVTPPSAKAECQASAKAEASMNVQCSPPRVVVEYRLAAGADIDLDAQARFKAGLGTLQARLPSLLVEMKRAKSVLGAADGLRTAATGAVRGAIEAIDVTGDLQATVGVGCALGELGAVGGIVTSAGNRLNESREASVEIGTALNLGSLFSSI